MRFRRVAQLLAFGAMVGTAVGYSVEAKQRIALKLILADGTELRVTAVEGRMAEIKQAGPTGFHLGLVPTKAKQHVAVQLIQLADGSRKPLAKVTGPPGEPMDVHIGAQPTDPPTLRIIPERVY